MADRYDAIVIGAGPVGQVCAGELADGGMRVAIVERELVGGECSYWACIPSKTLLRPGEARRGGARGARRRRGGHGLARPRAGARVARLHDLLVGRHGRGRLARRQGHRPAARRGPDRRARAGGGRRHDVRDRPDRDRHRLVARDPADRRPARPRRRVDQPRGHGVQGAPGAADRARRRSGGRGAGAGVPALRQRGDARARAADHLLPREAPSVGEAVARRSRPRASSCGSASTPSPRRRATATATCSASPTATDVTRRQAARRHRPARRASTSSASTRSASSRASRASRSTSSCAPATASGRSATPPGSCRSRTSASTRRGSAAGHPRRRPRAPTTGRCRASCSATRRSRPWASRGRGDGHGASLAAWRARRPTRASTPRSRAS